MARQLIFYEKFKVIVQRRWNCDAGTSSCLRKFSEVLFCCFFVGRFGLVDSIERSEISQLAHGFDLGDVPIAF